MTIADSQKVEIVGAEGACAALSALLSQEAEAVGQYKAFLSSLPDGMAEVRSEVAEILSDEENHIGRLVSLLSSLDPQAGEKIGSGIEGEE